MFAIKQEIKEENDQQVIKQEQPEVIEISDDENDEQTVEVKNDSSAPFDPTTVMPIRVPNNNQSPPNQLIYAIQGPIKCHFGRFKKNTKPPLLNKPPIMFY